MVRHTSAAFALAGLLLGAVMVLATLATGRSGAANSVPGPGHVTTASTRPARETPPTPAAVVRASQASTVGRLARASRVGADGVAATIPSAPASTGSPVAVASASTPVSPGGSHTPRIAVDGAATTAASVPASAGSPFVTRSGTTLLLAGEPWTFVGVNGPSTDYAVNGGCGAAIDYASLFASLPPNSVYRTSFGQDLAINDAHQRDWDGYDEIVNAAAHSPTHIKLIVSLASESGVCDGGHFKDAGWYEGGYRNAYSDYEDGVPRESYWQYIHEVITRYRDSSAIAMWELVGEPEASVCDPGYVGGSCYSHKTCPPNAAGILRHFFDSVGSEVHRIDPNHLVSDGALGGQQCGWAGSGGLQVESSQAIDVLAYHDYYGVAGPPLPAEFAGRIREAGILDKPIVSEEVGISARDTSQCISLPARSQDVGAKLAAARGAGVSGFVLWTYAGAPDPAYAGCDDYIFADDPVLSVLRSS